MYMCIRVRPILSINNRQQLKAMRNAFDSFDSFISIHNEKYL